MSRIGLRQVSATTHLLRNFAVSYLTNFRAARIGKPRPAVLKPLFVTYYVTWSCNFNCEFCHLATTGLVKQKDPDQLDTNQSIKLLEIIRKACPVIYFTGGEPLTRKDLPEILAAAKKMGFLKIGLNTNASLINRNPEVLEYITDLVLSITTLDSREYIQIMGITPKMAEQTQANFRWCAEQRNKLKSFDLTVNCVVTPSNIESVREVMNFCDELAMRFAVVPVQLDDGLHDPKLERNRDYEELIDEILRRKRSRKAIFNSYKYLKIVRNFDQYACNPSVVPHVDPAGRLFWPCVPIRWASHNLRGQVSVLESGSYQSAVDECIHQYGPPPLCGNRCYIACYVEPAVVLKSPSAWLGVLQK